MINLIKQSEKFSVATDEDCTPKLALSERGIRGNI